LLGKKGYVVVIVVAPNIVTVSLAKKQYRYSFYIYEFVSSHNHKQFLDAPPSCGLMVVF